MWERVRAITVVAVAIALGACSDGGGQLPPGPGDDSTSHVTEASEPQADAATPGPACADFTKRECTIDLGVVNGVHNCAKGVQICENGQWASCKALDP
jgi:hypothetical protein